MRMRFSGRYAYRVAQQFDFSTDGVLRPVDLDRPSAALDNELIIGSSAAAVPDGLIPDQETSQRSPEIASVTVFVPVSVVAVVKLSTQTVISMVEGVATGL